MKLPYDYICCDCAEARGATWPEGHYATSHTARCEYCGKMAGLCNIGDYDWPDGKPRGMRD